MLIAEFCSSKIWAYGLLPVNWLPFSVKQSEIPAVSCRSDVRLFITPCRHSERNVSFSQKLTSFSRKFIIWLLSELDLELWIFNYFRLIRLGHVLGLHEDPNADHVVEVNNGNWRILLDFQCIYQFEFILDRALVLGKRKTDVWLLRRIFIRIDSSIVSVREEMFIKKRKLTVPIDTKHFNALFFLDSRCIRCFLQFTDFFFGSIY